MVRTCCCKGFWTKSTMLSLGLGLLHSVFIVLALILTSQLAKKGINAPSSQCFLYYLLLALVSGAIMFYRRQPLKVKLYSYMVPALFDVLAIYFAIKAFQYTCFTSVVLLNYWQIPSVMLFSWLLFKNKIQLQELVGVAICVAGFVAIIFSDIHSAANRSSGIDPLKGDLLIIVGATFCGVSQVSEVFFVNDADCLEIMALLGMFGATLTAPQIAIFERSEFKSILSSSGTIFLVIGFSLAMFFMYSEFHLLSKIISLRLFNLSLLQTNMWVVLIRVFVYHEKVDWIYFVACVAVTLGLVVYSEGLNRRKEVDPNKGETPSTDEEEAGLDSAEILNKKGFRFSFLGSRNFLCYISCIVKCEGEVRGSITKDECKFSP